MDSGKSTSTTSDTVKLSPELAALAAEGAALDAASTPAPPPELGPDGQPLPPPAPVDYMGDAVAVVDFAADTLAAFYPSTESVLNADKRGKIATAAEKVLRKYNVNLAGLLGNYSEEIGLAWALASVAMPLAAAIRADRAAAGKAEKGGNPDAPATPMQPIIDRTDPASLHNKA